MTSPNRGIRRRLGYAMDPESHSRQIFVWEKRAEKTPLSDSAKG